MKEIGRHTVYPAAQGEIDSLPPEGPPVELIAVVKGRTGYVPVGHEQVIRGQRIQPQKPEEQQHIVYRDTATGEQGVMTRRDAHLEDISGFPHVHRVHGEAHGLPPELQRDLSTTGDEAWYGYTDATLIESRRGGDHKHKIPKKTNLAATKLR